MKVLSFERNGKTFVKAVVETASDEKIVKDIAESFYKTGFSFLDEEYIYCVNYTKRFVCTDEERGNDIAIHIKKNRVYFSSNESKSITVSIKNSSAYTEKCMTQLFDKTDSLYLSDISDELKEKLIRLRNSFSYIRLFYNLEYKVNIIKRDDNEEDEFINTEFDINAVEEKIELISEVQKLSNDYSDILLNKNIFLLDANCLIYQEREKLKYEGNTCDQHESNASSCEDKSSELSEKTSVSPFNIGVISEEEVQEMFESLMQADQEDQKDKDVTSVVSGVFSSSLDKLSLLPSSQSSLTISESTLDEEKSSNITHKYSNSF